MSFKYTEVFSRLTFETACIVFVKKDGTFRSMLGTRNLHTAELKYGFKGAELGGHDNRCNINNGNIAVFDIILGEARSFNIDRLVDIQFLGEIKNMDQLNSAAEQFMQFKEKYESMKPENLTIDDLN